MVAAVDLGSVSLARHQGALLPCEGGCTFLICLKGHDEAVFGGTAMPVTPGTTLVIPRHRPDGTAPAGATGSFALWFNGEAWRALPPSLDGAAFRMTGPGDPAAAMLAAYCAQLMAMPGGVPAPLARLASRQLSELAAHLLDSARSAPFGGRKAVRLRAVLDHIADNLCDPELGAAAVGSRLGLTARCVQQLLEAVGLSFCQHVRRMRLDEARRLLADPRHDHMRIIDIAYATGFQDLSYFNREFRRRFGEKPSAVRGCA
jgi:AraC-like DNA-binding protein